MLGTSTCEYGNQALLRVWLVHHGSRSSLPMDGKMHWEKEYEVSNCFTRHPIKHYLPCCFIPLGYSTCNILYLTIDCIIFYVSHLYRWFIIFNILWVVYFLQLLLLCMGCTWEYLTVSQCVDLQSLAWQFQEIAWFQTIWSLEEYSESHTISSYIVITLC